MQMTFVPSSTISDPRVNHENWLSLDRIVTFTPLRPAIFSKKTYPIAFAQKQAFFYRAETFSVISRRRTGINKIIRFMTAKICF